MAKTLINNAALSERDVLSAKYVNARRNLIAVALITLLNVILAATSSDSYFLFSATIPYLLTFLSAVFCGMYPPEFYEGEFDGMVALPAEVFYICLAISVLIIALYVLAFFFSNKNKVGWLIFALVLFCLDTLVLLLYGGLALDWILDYVFHVWIIVILCIGIRAHSKLKKLPEETATLDLDGERDDNAEAEAEGSEPIRAADMSVKQRVFLATEFNGNSIVYRRVNRVNELIINGQVYDEYGATVEMPHVLSATIDGHLYEAGLDRSNRTFIIVDGQQLASKLRLY